MKMTKERAMELLRTAVDHIENFEEDEAEKVFESLGFTDVELAEIRGKLSFSKEEEGNEGMIADHLIHNGQIILVLSEAGSKYIFSDQREDDKSAQGFVTDCVPFKNYPHYIYPWTSESGTTRYTAFAWYNRNENYIEDFNSLEEAIDWLTSEY